MDKMLKSLLTDEIILQNALMYQSSIEILPPSKLCPKLSKLWKSEIDVHDNPQDAQPQ